MIYMQSILNARLGLICSMLLLAGLYSCDTLNEENNDVTPSVTIIDKEVHVVSSGSAYIDLFSKVRTNSTVRFDISEEPAKGNLSPVAAGLLKYSPMTTFKKGRDSFTFTVFDSRDNVLTVDSVIIIVDDSTNLPCNYYPKDDSVTTTTTPVIIHVLANDYLCGDTSDLRLEIYRPSNNFPPFFGTATLIEGNRIKYTANTSAPVSDSIVYKVSRLSNSSVVGYATVHINANVACASTANDDYFEFVASEMLTDSVLLNVLQNDKLCDSSFQTLKIKTAPKRGSAIAEQRRIRYTFPDIQSQSILDSLQYEVCNDQRCVNAKVRIQISK